ncbi:MAG: phage tail tape measure protein, partial [Patescibacteria group bacterium]
MKSAMDFEQTSVALTTMLKDSKLAGDMLKDLSKFAETTPFEFPEIADAGKRLLAFGFSAKEINGTLRSLGDISSALNIPLGELSDIYGKARVQGRLFAEDLNQLTGRGIPVTQELAKQF